MLKKMADYQKAKEKAQGLLKELKISEPVVNVFDIAKAKGLDIIFVKMPDNMNNVSGFFDPNTKRIYINSEEPPYRQAFTAAHELGHYILEHEPDKYGVLPRFASPVDRDPIEQEANCFAANLLVPESMLKEAMEKYSLTENDLDLLARIFGVSTGVIKYRLKWLK